MRLNEWQFILYNLNSLWNIYLLWNNYTFFVFEKTRKCINTQTMKFWVILMPTNYPYELKDLPLKFALGIRFKDNGQKCLGFWWDNLWQWTTLSQLFTVNLQYTIKKEIQQLETYISLINLCYKFCFILTYNFIICNIAII